MEDFIQLWVKILTVLELLDIEWAACILRNLWLRRNEVIFNKFKIPTRVVLEAKFELENYHLAMNKEHTASTAPTRSEVRMRR